MVNTLVSYRLCVTLCTLVFSLKLHCTVSASALSQNFICCLWNNEYFKHYVFNVRPIRMVSLTNDICIMTFSTILHVNILLFIVYRMTKNHLIINIHRMEATSREYYSLVRKLYSVIISVFSVQHQQLLLMTFMAVSRCQPAYKLRISLDQNLNTGQLTSHRTV